MRIQIVLLLALPLFVLTSCKQEDCISTVWYEDVDGDGLGNPASAIESCTQPDGFVANSADTDDWDEGTGWDYSGTASVTQGTATTITTNLYDLGQRVAGLGTIEATDGSVWTVPAVVNYGSSAMPFAPDLYNPDGAQHATAEEALLSLDPANVLEIDADGELITGYIFADNYFELYVNGVAVGKDAIPFTPFNSSVVQFRVARPFTVAMLLVDWEENLGLGTESAQGFAHHAGDGGVVAVFRDADGNTVATTGGDWKAQTFYTAPIRDLSCAEQDGNLRLSSTCDVSDTDTGDNFYALHWELPGDWMMADFDDSDWPDATTFSNATIGVDNKIAYTNFTDIFDDPAQDAEFIWSTNVILDNEVVVRHRVD